MNFQNPFWNKVAIKSSDKYWVWKGAVLIESRLESVGEVFYEC